jgi:predicted hotdog family 3-hydroxylacyl-ACP dehydratase
MNKVFTVEQVVPHAGPMSLLDTVDAYGDDWLQASASIDKDNLFLTDGQVPAWVGIEYMAQAIAAHAGVQSLLKGGEVKVGFLVGTRKYTTSASSFPLGSQLTITVKQVILGENGLGAFSCQIQGHDNQGNPMQASASLNVFQPDNIDEILADSVN